MVSRYDTLARHRIWNKLEFIRSRYPALTLSDIADRITVARGTTFNRRYFDRLRKGTLRDGRVNDIVEWITENYDPSFKRTIVSCRSSHDTPSNVSPINPIIYPPRRHWRKAPPALSKTVRDFFAIEPISDILSSANISVECSTLTFLDSAQLIRAHCFLYAELPSMYFIEYKGRVAHFDGTVANFKNITTAIPKTMGVDNALSFLEFYIEFIEGRRIAVIRSLDDIHQFISGNDDQHGASTSRLLDVFEPIAVNKKDDIFCSTFFFDYIEGAAYFRAVFKFRGGLHRIGIRRECIIENIFDVVDSNAVTYTGVKSCINFVDFDLEGPVDIMKATQVGASLLHVFNHHKICIKHIHAPHDAYVFDLKSKTILHSFNPNICRSAVEEAFHFVHVLRRADMELAGFVAPDWATDTIKYGAHMHATWFEALTTVCEFISQALSVAITSNECTSFLRKNRLVEFYDLTRKKAPKEALYKEYSRIYNITQRE